MPDHIMENGDSPELEALFNSIAQQQGSEPEPPAAAAPAGEEAGAKLFSSETSPSTMYEHIGQMTRKMHDALRDLGYDKSLEKVAETIPDAKDRLAYIATLTENSAERVLNATDIAKPFQDKLESQAAALSERWEKLFANLLSIEEFKNLAAETQLYLKDVPNQTQATNAQLLEIVMAQDFQDLTGQVIKKMMGMVKILETELVSFLIEFSPDEKKGELNTSLLNGPVINPEGRTDVVNSQQQVDDLLESLGF
ncbi:protein phosphatase CheZ [Chromobacterium vaccinii]|uniref:Protein phosphatase CheZ n=2 Tax=Chromobacterium TaxID=535 RepID=A0A1D9LNT1_9NEIS|nr:MULTISPECIES: protein phosphatase CheZ [Chromobacteriaceae]AOZ52783.1 protein phosphatase CheZ [Chromobacterium vaccinii]AVG18796.1 protein phosphatase CheZ [Chromobacterium vaccinii]MCD4485457.1 protein phosphatase CheZ [Chromobacterium vaccinii]MCD4500134.1 protein phosphatase CheZ [Chromobacterium vaccinii]QND83930.1 Chemotaxis response - phosphatase CheZ [Chromobacterium vaccinii]